MSPAADEPEEAPPPRLTDALYGHADAEAALVAAYRGGRVPHALLLIGPKGIGKATLAYRFARFVLAHPDPAAPEVQAATSLAVDPEHPVARRMAAQAQADLLVIERTANDPHVTVALVAGDGGAITWPALTSLLKAKQYLLTGDRCRRARRWPSGWPTSWCRPRN